MACTAVVVAGDCDCDCDCDCECECDWDWDCDGLEEVSKDKSSDRGATVAFDDDDEVDMEEVEGEDGSSRSDNDTMPSGVTFSVRIFMIIYIMNKIARQNIAPETRPRMNEPPAERSWVALA